MRRTGRFERVFHMKHPFVLGGGTALRLRLASARRAMACVLLGVREDSYSTRDSELPAPEYSALVPSLRSRASRERRGRWLAFRGILSASIGFRESARMIFQLALIYFPALVFGFLFVKNYRKEPRQFRNALYFLLL